MSAAFLSMFVDLNWVTEYSLDAKFAKLQCGKETCIDVKNSKMLSNFKSGFQVAFQAVQL